jgi:hypothetical protein
MTNGANVALSAPPATRALPRGTPGGANDFPASSRLDKIARETDAGQLRQMRGHWQSGDPIFGPPLTSLESEAIARRLAEMMKEKPQRR